MSDARDAVAARRGARQSGSQPSCVRAGYGDSEMPSWLRRAHADPVLYVRVGFLDLLTQGRVSP